MSVESDLLRVVLALQMGFVTREQVVECGALWAEDRRKPLADLLEEKGYLKAPAAGALDALVRAKEEAYGGDPAESLAASPLDADLRKTLLGLPLDEEVKGTLMEHAGGAGEGGTDASRRPPAVAEEPAVLIGAREERYEPGAELGRGGLGRVVAGRDKILGREVAIKEMLRGSDPAFLKRFLREGEIAGRLSHPNVIPVHDIGVREEPGLGAGRAGRRVPYFVMARIVGHDLKEILRAVEHGSFDPDLPDRAARETDSPCPSSIEDRRDPRKEFSRARLLGIFQDVCLAMAYAHDHGVIHRDLKPANVMVGKYGEVYVVDWGLAKVMGQVDDPAATLVSAGGAGNPASIAASSEDPRTGALTLEGDVLGTPQYMPPEQADGRIDEVDERSDIYSLGAVLYEILTFRPPYEGTTGLNVIAKVLAGDLTPPSERASELRRSSPPALAGPSERGGDDGCGPAAFDSRDRSPKICPDPVPPELEEIVLKAMAKDKALRFGSVMELHDEVQRFLDGEKERERNRERAMAKVAAGEIHAERMERLRIELQEVEGEVKEKGRELKGHWPVEKKAGFWGLKDEAARLRRELVDAFTEAENTFLEALTFERRNAGARSALADLYWDRYLREEEGGDESETLHYEKLVRQYNDGQYDARLKGDGTLAVSTRSFPCRCLTDGRTVPLDQMKVAGLHPFSGRALDGREAGEGLPRLEPGNPVRLKVHGPACETEPLDGADAWLFRYVEEGRILLPRFPDGAAAEGSRRMAVPPAVLDLCFHGGSPHRPEEGLHLGRTPIPRFPLPGGSYLIILHKEGFRPVRRPVHIGRLGGEEVRATLYREGEVPEGFAQVPAGQFIFQGDKAWQYSTPKAVLETGDYFMAVFPVTCREYLEFLNELASANPDEARRRIPRAAETTGEYWPLIENGTYVIPTARWLAEAPAPARERARRLVEATTDWEEDWPVYGVSWEDLASYARWAAERSGRVFALPHEVMWEKGARGVDGRFFPWGNALDGTFCNMNISHDGPMRPCPVDSFPVDESPYGIRGLSGNSCDICLNGPGSDYSGWRVTRGGSWAQTGTGMRAAVRTMARPSFVLHGYGGRLVFLPVLPVPGKGWPPG